MSIAVKSTKGMRDVSMPRTNDLTEMQIATVIKALNPVHRFLWNESLKMLASDADICELTMPAGFVVSNYDYSYGNAEITQGTDVKLRFVPMIAIRVPDLFWPPYLER
jgi:hypothetical protein